ncbi:MAG: DNA primase [Cardiobacteriaceae bacterium]|nr:DNA primase [Cardiobacteriaceae bacterium]
MKRIAKPFIDELVARTRLGRLVGAPGPLANKSGSNHWACCPFHEEKTPSFSVNEAQQFYHCFGCGVGGDAIRFLMDLDNLTFVEAIEQLADFNGMAVEYEETRDDGEAQRKRARSDEGLLCLQAAAAFFVEQLYGDKGQASRAYLRERGLKKSTLDHFMIGYAPPGNALREHLVARYGEALLLETGLLGKAEDGHTYDWFRDRIIFPIHNVKGQVIAFGGRAVGNAMPKYLNSPETPWFSKRHELYGLHQAMKAPHRGKTLLVTEGYMDVVKLAQHGMDHAVAALGTAIGETHIVQLGKRAGKVTFAFDGDQAGEKAAEKALDAIFAQFNEQCEWRFAFLPPGEDPDSLVEQKGIHAMQDVLDASITPSAFLLRLLDDGAGEARSAEGNTALMAEARQWLKKLPQGDYRQQVARVVQERFALGETLQDGLPAPVPMRKAAPPRASVREATAADLRLLAIVQSCPRWAFTTFAALDAMQEELPLASELAYRICACGDDDAVVAQFVAEYALADKLAALARTLAVLKPEQCLLELEDTLAQMLARRDERSGRLEKLRG